MAEGFVVLGLLGAWGLATALVIRADARAEAAFQRWYDAQPWSAKSLSGSSAKGGEQSG